MAGINYIIREPHYEENCFKIGTSSSETIKRICDYKKGTQIICILKSNNSTETEKIIKRKFSSSFVLTSGSEYFSGDEYQMMKLFIEIIMDYNKDNTVLVGNAKNTDLLIINNEKEIDKKIKKLFKKYKFDDFEVLDKINKYIRIVYNNPSKIYIYLSLEDNDILINNTINTNRKMWGLQEIKL